MESTKLRIALAFGAILLTVPASPAFAAAGPELAVSAAARALVAEPTVASPSMWSDAAVARRMRSRMRSTMQAAVYVVPSNRSVTAATAT